MQGLTVACYGEIVAAGSPECQCVCVCVWERERERESVCVCVYFKPVRPSSIPPLNYHPPLPLVAVRQHAAWQQLSDFQSRISELSGNTALSNFDRKRKRKKRMYRQTKTSLTVYRSSWTIDSGGVSKRKNFIIFFHDFQKKSGKSYLKKWKVKKKAEFCRKAEDWHPCSIHLSEIFPVTLPLIHYFTHLSQIFPVTLPLIHYFLTFHKYSQLLYPSFITSLTSHKSSQLLNPPITTFLTFKNSSQSYCSSLYEISVLLYL